MNALLVAILFLGVASAASAQTTWYCDSNGGGAGDGSAGAPFQAIQAGIDAAVDGDLVFAAPGTYMELLDFSGKAITVRGSGIGMTFVDGGQVGTAVSFVSGEGAASRLEHLTVQRGLGEPLSPGAQPVGGGLLIRGSSPTIEDCGLWSNGVISSVIAGTLYGGAAYIENGSPAFGNTTFFSNRSCSGGGAVAVFGASSPSFDHCTFANNITNSFPGLVPGGAVYSVGFSASPPVFTNCAFNDNFSDRGGAIAGPAHVFDSIFSRNQSSIGGAVYEVSLLERCEFFDNNAQCYFAEERWVGDRGQGRVTLG